MYITQNTNVTFGIRPHGNKTIEFKFRNRTTKSSNQNAVVLDMSFSLDGFKIRVSKTIIDRFFDRKTWLNMGNNYITIVNLVLKVSLINKLN